VFPRNSDVLVVRGAAYTLMGDLEKARSDFAEAVHLAPRQAGPRFFLALSEYRQGDYAGSSAEITSSVKSGVAEVVGYFELRLNSFQATSTPATVQPMESTSVTIGLRMRTGICIMLLFPPSAARRLPRGLRNPLRSRADLSRQQP